MSFFNKASLLTIPTAYKQGKLYSVKPDDGSGDFNFTRSTSATRVNEAGLIEKERENLLLQSNTFNNSWEVYDVNPPINGFSGYDGSTNAWLISENTDNDDHWIRQLSSITSGIGTFSFYAKKKDYDFIQFAQSGDGAAFANFNINNGTIGNYHGSLINVNIESKGNGWYRCSVTYSFNTNAYVGISLIRSDVSSRNDIYLGNGTNGTYIQDAQLEQGLVATDYIETTTSTVATGITTNVPRIDYSGTPSLLLEPQRTNLINYSEYFDHSQWNNPFNTVNCIITKTNDINPAGEASAYSYEATGSSNQIAYLSYLSTGINVTNSIYVKRVTGTGDVILKDVNNVQYYFSLDVADGWKRIDTTAVLNSSTVRFYLNLQTIGDKILIWGAQQEEGAYATSYIPTYGTSVTRAIDDCFLTNAQDLIGQTEGTLYCEFLKSDDGAYTIVEINLNDSTNNRLLIYAEALNTRIQILLVTGGVQQFNNYFLYSISNRNKIALTYTNNNFKLFINGSLEWTSTSGTLASSYNYVALKDNNLLSRQSKTVNVITFPTILTDAECITLTTI